MSARLHWSYGVNRYDARPTQHEGTLRDLALFVQQHRAASKARAGYICGPMSGDGRRCRANAAPRAWLALDVDHIDADVLGDWRLHLAAWRGIGWATASSTAQAPRERVVIELDEHVDRASAIRIGALLTRDVADIFGASVRLDACAFRAEQPAFMPVGNVSLYYLTGDPLRVQEWLAQAPPPPPEPPQATAADVAIADARMRWLVDALGRAGLLRRPLDNERGYALACPWGAQHTTQDAGNSSATVLLFPAEGNGWRGGFRCLHSHCEHRRLRDLERLLQAAHREREAA